MALSYEQCIHWYRLATAALIAIAAFAVLSLLLPTNPSRGAGFTAENRLWLLVLECSLGAAFATVAVRLKDAVAVGEEEPDRSRTFDLEVRQVRTRWASFRQIGEFWLPAEKTEHPVSASTNDSPAVKAKKPAVTGKSIKNSDNADLARRAESDVVRLRRK